MRYLKVLGLAVVAVAAMMAVFGAGSASAVQICKTVGVGEKADGKCPTLNDEFEYDGPIVATATNPELTNSITNVTCENSSTTVDPVSSTGTTIAGEVTALSFTGNCKTAGGTACTVTVLHVPYTGNLATESLTVADSEGAGATVKCGFLINCTFTRNHVELTVTHEGDDTVVHAKEIVLDRSGGFCPETAKWDATYFAHGVTVI